MPLIEVNEANFDAEVLHCERPVLVDFWAPWCQPCLMLMPAVQALEPIYAQRLKIVKVNCDEAQPLARRYGVRGIPHLVLFKQGEAAAVLQGRNKTRLAMEIDRLLAATQGAA